MVGIPSGRSPPFGFGMLTRRIGLGRYVFETSSSRSPANHASRPDRSMSAKVTPSTPGAPAFHRASAIGVSQDVFTANLVVEQIEAVSGLRLRLTIQLS